jgi:hypothetical protein
MKHAIQQVRQGDILLVRVFDVLNMDKAKKSAKESAKENGYVVLARGEVTGHCHVVDATKARLFEHPDGLTILVVEKDCELEHLVLSSGAATEDHAAVALTPGAWQVVRQREYVSPEEVRRVAD